MMKYVLLVLFLAACGAGLDLASPNCYLACTDGKTLIHVDCGEPGSDEWLFCLNHEGCHISLDHKFPSTPAKELAADDCAEDLTLEIGISPCPAARLLLQEGQLARAFALGERNSCAGFGIR